MFLKKQPNTDLAYLTDSTDLGSSKLMWKKMVKINQGKKIRKFECKKRGEKVFKN